MLRPIEFNDEFAGPADEVGVVRSDRRLTHKFRISETTVAKTMPELLLRFR